MTDSDSKSEKTWYGAIGVFGRTNAGKSTLVNALVGEKVSIVSKRPQTTRKRILGIVTKGAFQIVFCDTPGFHPLRNKLDAFMEDEIQSTVSGLEGALYLIDVKDPDPETDAANLEKLFSAAKVPVALVFTKMDTLTEEEKKKFSPDLASGIPFEKVFEVSSRRPGTLDSLLKHIKTWLPEGPHAYAPDDFTSASEREIAAEVIREEILNRYYHEVPHSSTVVIEEFKERENGKTYISATIVLEKESQKKIFIGNAGEGIKALGTASRQQLNQILGRDIFLEIWVKVRTNWRKDNEWIRRLGYRQK